MALAAGRLMRSSVLRSAVRPRAAAALLGRTPVGGVQTAFTVPVRRSNAASAPKNAAPKIIDPENPEKDGYRLVVGTIVERMPPLVSVPEAWEVEWEQFQDELDQFRAKHIPLDMLETDKAKDENAKINYKQNPRVTEAEVKGNLKSLNRELDRGLFLLVKLPGKDFWHFPLGTWKPGETVRQTAERTLSQSVGQDLDSYFLGNAPIGHVKYEAGKLPLKALSEGTAQGANVFLCHSIYLGGLPSAKGVDDFIWVPREEFKKYLDPQLLELAADMIYT